MVNGAKISSMMYQNCMIVRCSSITCEEVDEIRNTTEIISLLKKLKNDSPNTHHTVISGTNQENEIAGIEIEEIM